MARKSKKAAASKSRITSQNRLLRKSSSDQMKGAARGTIDRSSEPWDEMKVSEKSKKTVDNKRSLNSKILKKKSKISTGSNDAGFDLRPQSTRGDISLREEAATAADLIPPVTPKKKKKSKKVSKEQLENLELFMGGQEFKLDPFGAIQKVIESEK